MTAYAVATEAKIAMRDFVGTPTGRAVLLAITDNALGKSDGLPVAQDWANVIDRTLGHAVPHYVSPEVCEALIAAAPAVPDYELHREDVSHPYGWVYFSRPLPIAKNGDETGTWLGPVLALSWAPITVFLGERDMSAEFGSGYKETAGEIVDDLSKANAVSITIYREWQNRKSGIPIASIVWRFEQKMLDLYTRGREDYGYDGLPNLSETTLQEMQYFAALVAFMGQELFPTRREQLPRDARKRLARAGYDPGSEENTPRVIYLRRISHSPETPESGYTLTHRFWVKAHWRNQWYPSEDRHKPLWIHPYIKGPDGLPIAARREQLVAIVR